MTSLSAKGKVNPFIQNSMDLKVFILYENGYKLIGMVGIIL